MNTDDAVEGSIDLGTNRKRKCTSVQHMQNMLLPKVKERMSLYSVVPWAEFINIQEVHKIYFECSF